MDKVNLDALIPREDFDIVDSNLSGKKKETISIEDLKSDSFFFMNIRKPDFQRETNEWDSVKIVQLIKSFIKGELIPAVILWRSSGGYLFVIDGSHRLSALSAWINDDYGDGRISKMFYDGVIPEEQKEIAEKTRKIIEKEVGTYEDYKLALTHPTKVSEDIVKNSKNLGALAIQLQWVEGDSKKAENSFFKINQQAAPINNTEMKLLKNRKLPSSIAARAVVRSGKGHKYWSQFEESIQSEIQDLAKQINEILFSPRLEKPIRTLDLPIGGKDYTASSLPLILDFIDITNNITVKSKQVEDLTGEFTIKYLKRTLKICNYINSNHPSSLGLHPIIYFYSKEGRHKPAQFYAIAKLIIDLEQKNKFNSFIKVREKLETFLWNYDYILQQINRKYRSAQNSYPYMSQFIIDSIEILENGIDEKSLPSELQKIYPYITLENNNNDEVTTNKFDTDKKSAVFIKEALDKAGKCNICNGLVHKNSISIDHIKRKSEGGLANVENGQITHPYCNTGYKN